MIIGLQDVGLRLSEERRKKWVDFSAHTCNTALPHSSKTNLLTVASKAPGAGLCLSPAFSLPTHMTDTSGPLHLLGKWLPFLFAELTLFHSSNLTQTPGVLLRPPNSISSLHVLVTHSPNMLVSI